MNSSFFRTGSMSMLATLAGQAFAVLHFALSARALSLEALGIWAFFLTLVSFVDMARLGLIQNALGHFLSKEDDHIGLFSGTLALSAAIQIGGALVLWGIASLPGLEKNFPGLFQLSGYYILLAGAISVMRFYEHAAIARQDFRQSLIVTASYGSISTLLLGMAMISGVELTPATLVLLQIPAALGSTLIAAAKQRNNIVFRAPTRYWIRKIFAFGRYGMASGITSMLMQRADILQLSALVAPAELALYGIATRVISWIDMPLGSWGLAIFPRLARSHRDGGENAVSSEYDQAVGAIAAFIIPLGLGAALFAEPIVKVLGGSDAAAAAPLVQILALSGLIKPWGRMSGVLLDATGHPRVNFTLVLLSCLINVIFIIIFATQWGITGAALAGGSTIWITVVAGQFILRRFFPVSFKRSTFFIMDTYARFWHKISHQAL